MSTTERSARPRKCSECGSLTFTPVFDTADLQWRGANAEPYCSDACISDAAERQSAGVIEKGYPSS